MMLKARKPKNCPCGIRFTPRGLEKYHSVSCELKHKTGNVEPENLLGLSLPTLKSIARGTFQAWVKKRDTGKPCISCDKEFKKGDIIHAGHYYKCEVFPGLMFHPDNCHSQCDLCNVGLDGNLDEYETGLKARIGVKEAGAIITNFYDAQNHKYSKLEYIEIINKYKALLEK